ncbi:MAG: hypothetical protein AAB407_02215 [Patescibacteria group bacterium]
MAPEKNTEREVSNPSSRKGGMIWLVILLIVAIGVVLWLTGNLPLALGNSSYQAVFLTNDQVYFGTLTNANGQFPRLSNVFYLQVTQTLQPIGSGQPGTNLNLVKLGGELHGPVDEMAINRDQILFFEDLKDDSQVVTAIRQYEENQ